MLKRDLVIGLDFGSDSVRGVLVDARGTLVATESCPYPRWNDGLWRNDADSMYRQHPLDYFEAMTSVVRAIAGAVDAKRIGGISIDTTGSTPSAVGADGKALALDPRFAEDPDAMFVLWKDHTAIEEAEHINRVARDSDEKYLDCCGGTYSEEWFFAKVLRLIRRAPRVAEAAATYAECGDYLVAELTGNTAPETMLRNRCAAAHKALWNAKWHGLPAKEFFAKLDPRLGEVRDKLYADTVCAGTRAGTLSPEWAARFGLDAQVVVGVGAMDGHSGAVGAGIRPGILLKSVGTSGNDFLVAESCDRVIPGICGQAEGTILPGAVAFEAGQAAVGDVFAWFRRILEYGGAKVDLRQLESDAAKLRDAAEKVCAIDFFAGRRTPFCDPRLAGALVGLTLGTTAPEIYLALLRAVAFGTRSIFDNYRANGLKINEVRVIGGVAVKSQLLRELLADALQMEMKLVDQEQCCALGAAMFAAVACGLHPDLAAAQNAMAPGIRSVTAPDPARREQSERLYRKYRELVAFEEKRTK